MSNLVTSLVKRRVVGSSARKAVLMYMADNASEDGTGVWTSKNTMAADLEMSKRTVQTHILGMIEEGILSETGKRKCRNGFTIEYCINLGVVRALKSTRAGDAPVQEMHPTGAGDAPHGVQEMHPNHSGTIQEPLLFGELEKPPPQKKQKRASQIPENWAPNDNNIQFALSKQFTQERISDEADRFRDHHLARGSKFKDWDAAWRTWVNNAIRFGNSNAPRQQRPGGYGQESGIVGALVRRRSQG